MLVLHAFELYTKQIIQYVFFDLLFLPLNVPFVPFVPAVACSCMTFYHGTTLSFSSPFSSQQMFGLFGVFFALAGSIAGNVPAGNSRGHSQEILWGYFWVQGLYICTLSR